MKIYCIVATDRNGAIGKNGEIPWRLSDDLKYFKRTTMGHAILMGRKSYESIGKALPGRLNIVITRSLDYTAKGCKVAQSIDEAYQIALDHEEDCVFVIGGGEIYRQTQDQWDKLYLTEVDADIPDADTFFPLPNAEDWTLQSKDCYEADDKNEYPFCFKILTPK